MASPARNMAAVRHRHFALLLILGVATGLGAYVAAVLLLVTPESRLFVQSRLMMEAKLARLEQPARPPHLIVIAGSNALYSVNSAVLSETVGRPVTNAAMQWNYAAMMMEAVADRVIPGDWVLLPLEWAFYENPMHRSPLEACYLLAQARERIAGLADWADVFYECNPRSLLLGMRQRLTRMAGFDFVTPPASAIIGPEGDMLENTPDAATFPARYRAMGIAPSAVAPIQAPTATASLPDFDKVNAFDENYRRLGAIIARLQGRGAEVFVTYPVVVEVPEATRQVGAKAWPGYVTPQWLEQQRDWVARHGGRLISTPGAHAFPPDCFYDTDHHLHHGCTAENARRYGVELLRVLASR